MAIPKPITRVEQYLAHISGMRVNVPEVPLTREEMYLAAWARKSGIEDTEMQGEPPLTLKDCIGEPFNGLVLYGKSTQVTTTGAQLFEPISDSLNLNGVVITFGKNGEKIVVSGTAVLSQEIQISKPIQMQAGEKYVLTLDEVHYFENIWLQGNGVRFGWSGKNTANKVIITVPDSIAERTDCAMYASVKEGEACNFTINHLMLNAGDTALPWEPYTGGKPSPSPDYPQEIQSAGDDGSIGIAVHGKNIFGGRYYYAMYTNGILLIDKSQKDKEVKFPYQPEGETRGICKVLKCQKGKTYVISVTNPNKNATIGMAEYENIENAYAHTKNVGFAVMTTKTKQLYTAKSDGILVCGIAGTWTDGKTTVHECTESELLQVEEASEATSYEPYHNPQTLTIPTPNGLPGIPVSSGGNYTDEQGQQWICDEVDLERGVKVQRVGTYKFYSSDGFTMDKAALGLTRFYIAIGDTLSADTGTLTSSALCSALPLGARGDTYGRINVFTIANMRLYINIENITSVNELQQYLQQTPMTLIALLATPIETPLSETDIAAYRALTTYKGTTILESECYLKVKYSKLRK